MTQCSRLPLTRIHLYKVLTLVCLCALSTPGRSQDLAERMLDSERVMEQLHHDSIAAYRAQIAESGDVSHLAFLDGIIASRATNFPLSLALFEVVDSLVPTGPANNLNRFWTGWVLETMGKNGAALLEYTAMLDSASFESSPKIGMRAHIGLGNVLFSTGRSTEALTHYGKVAQYFEAHPDTFMQAWIGASLANGMFHMGRYEEARKIGAENLALLSESPYIRRQSKQLSACGAFALKLGNTEELAQLGARQKKLEVLLGDSILVFDRIHKFDHLGWDDSTSRHPELFAFYENWEAFCVRNNFHDKRSLIAASQGYLHYLRNDYEAALEGYFRAAELAEKTGRISNAHDYASSASWFAEELGDEVAMKRADGMQLEALQRTTEENEQTANALYAFIQQSIAAEKRSHASELQLQEEKTTRRTFALVGVVLVLGLALAIRHQRAKRRASQLELENQERRSEQEVQSLLEKHRYENLVAKIKGEETERDRLAKEIHDGVGGVLAGIALKLENAEMGGHAPKGLASSLRKTNDDLRSISHNLALPELEDNTLVELTLQLLGNMKETYGYVVGFTLFPKQAMKLDNTLEIQLYRVIQELTTNTVKHAEATEVEIGFTLHPDALILMVSDNGKGFDNSKTGAGLGMRNVRERMAAFDGKVDIESALDKGCTATVHIPLPLKSKA